MSRKAFIGLLLVGIVFFAGGAGYVYVTKQEQIIFLENEVSDLESEIVSIQGDLSDKDVLIENLEDQLDELEYELEMDDSLRAPVETLNLKSGDCDDFSILVSALFEIAGIDSGIGFFQSDEYAHAMVLIHSDNLGE